MSISAISSPGLSPTPTQSNPNQAQQLLRQLAYSLQAGNLSDAQKAYGSLQKLLQTSGQSSGNSSSPVQQDFAALGQALSSGNLSQAQTDFSKLTNDAQPASQSTSGTTTHRHHHHHHADNDSTS